MAHAAGGIDAAPGDDFTRRTSALFFEVVGLLVQRGVTLVAEAAFQHVVWAPNLTELRRGASVVVVQCRTTAATALRRIEQRTRAAHADATLLATADTYFATFDRLHLDAPSIDVDTTDGYIPSVDDITRFVAAEAAR